MTIEEMYKNSWLNFAKKNRYSLPQGDAGGYRLNGDRVEYRQTEHNGDFSPNNPYMAQLRVANRQADIDALYELAVKWEADNSALQEQRDYDDPINQVARQRSAGINPDVQAGQGISSGSSAGLGEQDNSSPFGNTYAEQQIELQEDANKWNAVATLGGLATNIVSFGTSAAQIFDTLSTLPARRKLGNVQASIAEKTQDDVIASVGLGATSNLLNNVSSNIGILSNLSTLVGPDATDDDMTRTFTALGLPADSIPQYVSGVNEFRKNPNVKNYYANGQKQLNETEVYNQHYTSEVLGRMVSNDIAVRDLDFTLGIQAKRFKKSVNDYFMVDANARKLSSLQSTSLDSGISENVTNVENLDFMRQQIAHDVKAFSQAIEDTAKIYNESVRICDEIREQIARENRPATPSERAIMDSEYAKRVQIFGLGSQSLGMQYSMLQHTYMNFYQNDALMNRGYPVPNFLTNPEHTFMQNTFSFADVVNGTANANTIGNSLLNSVTSFGTSFLTKRPTYVPKSINRR